MQGLEKRIAALERREPPRPRHCVQVIYVRAAAALIPTRRQNLPSL